MESGKKSSDKLNIIISLIFLALIAAFGFYINRDIVIKGMYMDDLYLWSYFREENILEFAFPLGTAKRCRFIYWLAAYIQMMIAGHHITRFVTINIILNIGVAWLLYYMALKLSKSAVTALAVSASYLSSRFAYYQIGQVIGLMETMALFFAILVLWCLYRYIKEEKSYYAGLFVYFLLVFTHERYISLLPLFYLALIIRVAGAGKPGYKKEIKRNIAKWLIPVAELIVILLLRALFSGRAMPAGTGGTQVTDTFSVRECIGFALSQIAYIFGINAGPEYLSGISWHQTPDSIRKAVYAGIVLIALITAAYITSVMISAAKEKKGNRIIFENISAGLLFTGFIALCIGCSSVTIRVEMRWIYVSYSAALLYAAYMIGEIRGRISGANAAGAVAVIFAAYSILSAGINIFYRGYFYNIYFMPNQLRMNSLTEQTVEKYGTEGVFGKDIYLLENTYEMTDFYAETFFMQFDPEMNAEGTRVIFANSLEEVPVDSVRAGKALVLEEVPSENAYRDITADIMEQK